ncbi:MAG TPA: OmpA family protein [Verrucomicrobiae bacterium]|nr:OmpA family protein [Verrucomicrobiae bacterium]
MRYKTFRNLLVVCVTLAALVLPAFAAAQTQIQGVIDSRSGPSMTVKTQDSGNVTVLLSDDTQVIEPEGVFRKKHLALTALIPGLQVKVKGSYNPQNQLLADSVEFKGSSLQTAQDIQAGVQPTEQQVQAQQQDIQRQQAQIQAEQQATAQHAAEIAADKAAIAEANKRFGELGDYNILGEATVLFANGSTVVEEQYKQQLQKLAQQAKTVNAYVLLVEGYASKVGSAALNQKLSSERAENVTTYLEQQCGIPLTSMLAPGAMGTSKQVASDTTTEGQAENRRVVVKILQNKGVAGI